MASLLPLPSEHENAPAGIPENTSAAPETVQYNGAAASKPAGEPAPEAAPTADEKKKSAHVERAEEIVDRVASKVAEKTSVWGRKLLRLASRVKESAQDFWAEAQSIRRGDQP
jgi:hypothetical protein